MPDPLISLIIAAAITVVALLVFWPEWGPFWRWQQTRQVTDRVLREDALKLIQYDELHGDSTSVESLSASLNMSVNRVNEVLEDLKNHKLIKVHGSEFRLTPDGQDYALRIIRAHRVYERYLADQTGFSEAEWHTRAHELEHQITPSEVEELAALLGNPTHDPHGDPIPTADGVIIYHKEQILLTDLPNGTRGRIVHLEDEPETIYAQLVAEGLHVGQEIQLLEKSPQRIRFWAGEDEHILAPILARNLTVVPIFSETEEAKVPGQPLTTLKPGQQGKVEFLSPRIRGAERRRLMDLGLLPGTIIEVEMESAGGDPIAYRLRGALIALRKSQAELIRISPVL